MQPISPSPCTSPLKSLLSPHKQLIKKTSFGHPQPSVIHKVRCIHCSESLGGIGSSRVDSQTSIAIVGSKVASTLKDTDQTANLTAVNALNLVHPKEDVQKPLTITALPSMHGSQQQRVAYQGVPGAYSEAATGKAYPNCKAIPCNEFGDAFQAVESGLTDRAVLPIENSLGGSIHRNYDLLLRHRLHIIGEVQLPVHHCLVALPGVRKEDITHIISHPQALAQCELTLAKLGLDVIQEAVYNTAGAAKLIRKNTLRGTAAIASARAAELYGLQILADGIQDNSRNVTRFMVLARDPIVPRTDRPFKTSIVLAHDNGTTCLFKVLSAFAFRDIRLTKIESRPHRDCPIKLIHHENLGTAKHFEYVFYVDFEASMAEERTQNALAEVQEFTSFLRVLGSYPIDMWPWTPREVQT